MRKEIASLRTRERSQRRCRSYTRLPARGDEGVECIGRDHKYYYNTKEIKFVNSSGKIKEFVIVM
jgi:hypothetical protein